MIFFFFLAIYQYESAIGILMSPPSRYLPHLPLLSQSASFCALHHISNSHWLSVLEVTPAPREGQSEVTVVQLSESEA